MYIYVHILICNVYSGHGGLAFEYWLSSAIEKQECVQGNPGQILTGFLTKQGVGGSVVSSW